MPELQEAGAWASILGAVIGLGAFAISIWVLLRVETLSRRLVLDVRVPPLAEAIRKAASMLKDSKFERDLLEPDARTEVKRILARLERSRKQLPTNFGEILDQLKKAESAAFDGSVASMQELYTQMIIVSDTIDDLVQERRLGTKNG